MGAADPAHLMPGDDRIRDASIDIIRLLRALGLSVEEGCTALVYALVTACRAAGGDDEQILSWVRKQLDKAGM